MATTTLSTLAILGALLLATLKELHVPVLRWPGGCFAHEYHWKDGIGPRESARR